MRRSFWSYALRVLATILIFGVLFSQLDNASRLGEIVITMSPWALVAMLAFATADRWLMAYKWAYLLRAKGIYLSSFLAFKVYCFALAVGLFVPTSVGADVIRWYAIKRRGFSGEAIATSILVERAVGLIATILVAGTAILLMVYEGQSIPSFSVPAPAALPGGAIMIGMAVVVGLAWWGLRTRYPNWTRHTAPKIRQAVQAVMAYGTARLVLVRFSLLTLLEQFVPIVMALTLAMFLDLHQHAVYIGIAVPIAYLVSRLPISLGGVGVFEAVFVALTSQAGMPIADSLGIALIMRFAHILAWLPWWWLYTIESGGRKNSPPVEFTEDGTIVGKGSAP